MGDTAMATVVPQRPTESVHEDAAAAPELPEPQVVQGDAAAGESEVEELKKGMESLREQVRALTSLLAGVSASMPAIVASMADSGTCKYEGL